jgi:hypothetical protein
VVERLVVEEELDEEAQVLAMTMLKTFFFSVTGVPAK